MHADHHVVKVDATYDRVSFVIILGSAAPFLQPGAPDVAAGYYAEKVTGPDKKTYELQMLPSETGLKLAYYKQDFTQFADNGKTVGNLNGAASIT